jgi:Peptidase M50B-like
MLHRKIARLLQWLKLPIGVLALLYTPSAAWLCWTLTLHLANDLPYLPYFLGGLLGYGVVWVLWLRTSSVSFLSTLEHELTHAIFALLTFNKVTGFKATWRRGGHMDYEGTANWLIHLSPYFFPTLSVLLLIPMAFAPTEWRAWLFLGQGLALGYHLASTYSETHLNQKDLQLAGWWFCVCFLPFANLMAYALLLTGLAHGLTGIPQLLASLPATPLKPDPMLAWLYQHAYAFCQKWL